MIYVINGAPHYGSRSKQKRRMRRLVRKYGILCYYCQHRMLPEKGTLDGDSPSRDHKVPLSRGGSNSEDNIVLAHRRCNNEKGSLDAEEYFAWLDGLASRLDHKSFKKRTLPLQERRVMPGLFECVDTSK